jgi:hypothetical protein
MMRGAVFVLALVLVTVSAGTVLCEMNCTAGGHAESSAAMTDGAASSATSHCDGEQIDASRQNMPSRHGSSNGNTKHSGAHSHLRIVATVRAEVQVSAALTVSDFVSTPAVFGVSIFSCVDENFWNNNSSPPIKSPSVFSTGVLRI